MNCYMLHMIHWHRCGWCIDERQVREIAAIIGRARGWLDKAAALGERQAQEVNTDGASLSTLM